MKRPVALLVAVALLVSAIAGFADTIDDDPEAVSQYAKGKRLLREGDYLEASRVFERLAGRFPGSPNIDLFLYHRAKADYHFGDYAKAAAGFANFTARFPASPMVPYAVFFQANIDYSRGNLNRAVEKWIRAYADSDDLRLSDLVTSSLSAAITNAESVRMSPADFRSVPVGKRCELMLDIADALASREQFADAERLRTECGETTPGLEAVGGSLAESFDVAVVLPFSGELESFGEDLYNGAVIAAEQYRERTGRAINLSLYDTKGDPIDAARIVRELAGGNTDYIIGPLTSEEAAVASASLACDFLPLMAPAATQAGLTRLSETAFQLSPNVELQGVQMAEYAFYNIKADSAAIITSTNSDHLRMARAFSQRFTELGGTLLAIEYYRSREKDFGPYVRDIKHMILGDIPDSTYFLDPNVADTVDLDVIPAHIDCLFLPGTPTQLRLLLPQILFYNLNAALLGSDGWGDEAVYELDERITRRAVFPSPFLDAERSESLVRFAAAYDSRYGGQPGRLSRLGYDAVQLAIRAIENGGTTLEKLVDEMASIVRYDGAAGPVTFGDSRENTAMPLYQIEQGVARFIG
ncbi:ABC transporter substrate-binding protein, partial [candidate division GN15 bacterium]|nr:ABC transporter substrate-binding protein [candidate division GN15 bacterium]